MASDTTYGVGDSDSFHDQASIDVFVDATESLLDGAVRAIFQVFIWMMASAFGLTSERQDAIEKS